jgi:GntR family galactonate operon transcriptional repressor
MSAQIEKSLGLRIVSGEFPPGHVLPIENELCELYGVSRTTIREAMKGLAAKRLVEVAPKTGTRVRGFAEWNLLDRDVLAWRLNAQFDTKIIEDIFEMRDCFEPRAAFLAAGHGSAEHHGQIARHMDDLAAACGASLAPRVASEAALEFHLAVIRASQNGLFLTIGAAVKTALRVSSEMVWRRAPGPAEDVALHRSVCAAILARRPGEAAAAMRELLAASRARVLPLATDAARETAAAAPDAPGLVPQGLVAPVPDAPVPDAPVPDAPVPDALGSVPRDVLAPGAMGRVLTAAGAS